MSPVSIGNKTVNNLVNRQSSLVKKEKSITATITVSKYQVKRLKNSSYDKKHPRCKSRNEVVVDKIKEKTKR